MGFRIGHGYDVHRLVPGRRCILGGVVIPYEKGLLGHSDADVLVHAVMDALLGAAALGDIGQHFPDTDPAYAGADSIALLREVGALLPRQGRVREARQDRPALAGEQLQNLTGQLGVAAGLRLEFRGVDGLHAQAPGIRIRRGLRI